MNKTEYYNVWCCEKRWHCKWQAFSLSQGLAWGLVPGENNTWRKWHDKECGGKLIQLVEKYKSED